MSYLIKKDKKSNSIVFFNYDIKGYRFKPKRKENRLEVNELVIINPSLIDKILTIKFNKAFKQIILQAAEVIDDDDAGETDVLQVLDEAARLRSIILNKYQEFLKLEKEEEFLKKLAYLEKKLKEKAFMIMSRNNKTYSQYIGRGR